MDTVVVTKACAIPDPDTGGIRILTEGEVFAADHPFIEGRETHFGVPQVQTSTAAHAGDMSVKELRAALEDRGQSSKGNKAALMERYNNPPTTVADTEPEGGSSEGSADGEGVE